MPVGDTDGNKDRHSRSVLIDYVCYCLVEERPITVVANTRELDSIDVKQMF